MNYYQHVTVTTHIQQCSSPAKRVSTFLVKVKVKVNSLTLYLYQKRAYTFYWAGTFLVLFL